VNKDYYSITAEYLNAGVANRSVINTVGTEDAMHLIAMGRNELSLQVTNKLRIIIQFLEIEIYINIHRVLW
jgi:hypothetical protein